MTKYNIEILSKIFSKDAEIFWKDQREKVESFKQSYPDKPFPIHLMSEFNLAEALQEICEEICRLRRGVIRHFENENDYCLICKNEKVACVCIEEENELD